MKTHSLLALSLLLGGCVANHTVKGTRVVTSRPTVLAEKIEVPPEDAMFGLIKYRTVYSLVLTDSDAQEVVAPMISTRLVKSLNAHETYTFTIYPKLIPTPISVDGQPSRPVAVSVFHVDKVQREGKTIYREADEMKKF